MAEELTGSLGTYIGVTAADEAEAGPVPTALMAVTVKVYKLPMISPLTGQRLWPFWTRQL